MNGYHLQHGVASRDPFPHDDLQEGFPLLLFVLNAQLDLKLLYQLCRLLPLEVHDGIEHLYSAEWVRIREGGGAGWGPVCAAGELFFIEGG